MWCLCVSPCFTPLSIEKMCLLVLHHYELKITESEHHCNLMQLRCGAGKLLFYNLMHIFIIVHFSILNQKFFSRHTKQT